MVEPKGGADPMILSPELFFPVRKVMNTFSFSCQLTVIGRIWLLRSVAVRKPVTTEKTAVNGFMLSVL